jgi:beta-glucosidase
MNEPQQVANQGYRTGTHAPGRRDDAAASAATHHLLLAHGLAQPRLRATLPAGTPVGLSLDFHPIRTIGAEMEEIGRVVDAEENRIFLDPILHGHYPHAARARFLPPRSLIQDGDLELISAPLDFLGVNYYTPRYIKRALEDNESENGPRHNSSVRVEDGTPGQDPRTTMGWAIVPEAFYDLLRELGTEAPSLALYVTENGCAAEDYVDPQGEVNDFERIAYLRSHLEAAARAVADGVDLRGYFVWSLLDNFEWAWGYQKRFGLVFVDFSTQRRVPKRSSRFYAELARTGVIPAAPHASLTRPQAPHADLVDTSRETGLRSVPKT